MGTRSDIIVLRADGKWARIYCHWDGYLSCNGRILFDHYQDQAKADALMALGDLSSLGEEIGRKHDFEARGGNACTAYGRDRGEKGTKATIGDTLQDVWPEPESFTEYTYVYAPQPGGSNEPRWFVGDPDLGPASLMPLELALHDPDNFAPKPDIKAPWGVIGHRDEARAV